MRLPLSKILAIPGILGFTLFIYLTYFQSEDYALFMVPFVIYLIGLYFYQPAIDWWWYQKYPPEVEAPLRKLFESRLPYYQRLSEKNKQKFRTRVALYIEANDFRPQVIEEIPEDVKGVVAANIVQLTFGQKDFLLNMFERIVIYPGVFPTIQYLDRFHSSEIFAEDGVLLFAMDHLMPGTLHADQYFNIGIYEYAKVFRLMRLDVVYPDLSENIWADFEKISQFPQKKVEEFVGLESLDLWAVSVVFFFSFPEKFKTQLPDLYQIQSNLFNQYPDQAVDPVIARYEDVSSSSQVPSY